MSWKSYLFPQTILITSSPYNHHIRVNEEWGKMKLLVNRSPQSGVYIEKLWQGALRQFRVQNRPMQNILVLGLGGGTVLSMLSRLYPDVYQTCVDIDAVIIDIAKRYFAIGKIPHLTLVHDDAEKYVKRMVKQGKKYDSVIVDLSFGREIPSFVEEKAFLIHIKSLLTPSGCLLFNYLREKEYQEKSDHLYTTLRSVFPSVSDFEIAYNRFFFCK